MNILKLIKKTFGAKNSVSANDFAKLQKSIKCSIATNRREMISCFNLYHKDLSAELITLHSSHLNLTHYLILIDLVWTSSTP